MARASTARLSRGGITIVAVVGLTAALAACSPSASESAAPASSGYEPVTVDVCGTDVTFETRPERVFVYDSNQLEMLLALGLEKEIAQAMLWSDDITPELRSELERVGITPAVGNINDEIETVLASSPDMFYGGWNYGLRVGGAVTPEALETKGVKSYLLRESCRHVQPELGPTTMEDVYYDARALGRIFGVEDRAEELIADWQATIAEAEALVPEGQGDEPRVFLYDSGDEEPFTAGKPAVFTEMLRLAGAENVVTADKTWSSVPWEVVVAADPQVIPVVGYGGVSCDERIATLKGIDVLSGIDAIRNNRFECLTYDEVVPGIRTADATLKLAKLFWG